jgi:hypothetical protein
MKLHPKQIEAVVALPGSERYSHFIKQVADSREVWGLFKDGWANPTLPLNRSAILTLWLCHSDVRQVFDLPVS